MGLIANDTSTLHCHIKLLLLHLISSTPPQVGKKFDFPLLHQCGLRESDSSLGAGLQTPAPFETRTVL